MLSNKKGFTLIELLIVVVIIGILAAIAIPKFSNTKEKAYIASMKADLRNLVTAQEAYFSDFTEYQSGTCAPPNGISADLSYNCSAGVTVAFTAASGAGWNASATHTGTPTQTCRIATGSLATGTIVDGEPVCTVNPVSP